MRVSLNTIKQFTSVELPVDELIAKVNAQLGGVEETINLSERYRDALIVRVVSAVPHPNADRLRVCVIDDSGVRDGVERDDNGHVQVVCGAPNAETGMLAIWLPPSSTVPASFDEAEPFVLDYRELRGVLSHGMLASAKELAIGDDHNGIISITQNDVSGDISLDDLVGKSFAKVFGLDDQVIDIENKMFTHRPDLFGQLGVAREIAGIQHKTFQSPDWYASEPQFSNGEGLSLEVRNDAPEVVPRFMAVAIKNVQIKPSPLWLQCELVRLGSKPINNIVDITNYVMLLTAQPLHAYDYDKVTSSVLGARQAHQGEMLRLLSGKTIELDEADTVITDGDKAIGLGGVMGGAETEVGLETKNIILECAAFDMYTIRRTSMRHGLFTDAVTRFNKGQSALQNPQVVAFALSLIAEIAGGEQASNVVDVHSDRQTKTEPMEIATEFINHRLGLNLSDEEMVSLLSNVEFMAEAESGVIRITPPFWRTDIEVYEDIVEEVGRLYGFDRLPRELPLRTMKPTSDNVSFTTKKQIRSSLSRTGANEVLTYSFTNESVLKKAEQDVDQAFQLGNALSPDLQYYRLSVLPSLLDKVHGNIKSGYDEFALFEIGKGHNKKHHADDDDGLPRELEFVDIVYASRKPREGAPYYKIRRLVDQLSEDLGLTLVYKPITEPLDYPVTAPFDLSRSSLVETRDGVFIGMVGELKRPVAKSFKLPSYCAAATLDLSGIIQATGNTKDTYHPLSRYPSVTQDISLKASRDIYHAQVVSLAEKAIESQLDPTEYNWSISPLSIYVPDDDSHKTTTLRITLSNYEKTLTDSDVTKLLDVIAEQAAQKIDAIRV